MNTWPTLKEWWQFGGALAIEVAILFLAAKLIALQLRSAQWRRALWQTAMVAMFIVVMGELNGVRGFLHPRSEPPVALQPERAVVVTFKDAEMPAPLPLDVTSPDQFVTPMQPAAISWWQQRAAWPALAWLAGTLLVAGRMLLAQCVALVFRLRCRRIEDADLNARAERIQNTLGIRRRVMLVENKRAIAPFTFGTLRPVIVLPRRFMETFTPEQQDAALLHEMAHIAGFDSAWRCVSDLTGALFWWHPLVWLARRELAHASELAADESSLLLQDGPGHLAECLVACAKELRRPALTTWLGMDGGGFRSALGQRVIRLLALPTHARLSRPVPWYLRLIAPVVCTALLWIAMVTVMQPKATREVAWRVSILGNVFAAAPEKPAPIVSPQSMKPEVAKLIQDGKLFYETGQIEAARTNLETALKIDPESQGASYYLKLVQARESSMAERKPETVVAAATNAPPVDPARQAIYEKLRATRFAEYGPLDNLPLSEVLRALNDDMRRRDPERKGVNIMINSFAGITADELDAATGLPVQPIDLNGISIRLGTKLRDVSCEEILNIITSIAERPIQYTVETYAVVFTAKARSRQPMQTRFFRIDPPTLMQSLNSMQPPVTGKSNSGSTSRGGARRGQTNQINGGISFLTDVVPAESVLPAVRKWLAFMGVDLTAPDKAVFYNDGLALLMVRATAQELDTIEKGMQMLNMSPPQLNIRVKVMEVERDRNGKVGFDLYLGSIGAITNGVSGGNQPANDLIRDGLRNGASSEPRLAKSLTADQMRNTAALAPTITGILTDEQFRTVVKGLEQRGGTDLLSAPDVTTVSGRQAQIKVVDVKYIVTDLDITDGKSPKKPAKPGANAAKGNPTVDPQVTEDGSVIQPIAEPFELGPVVDIIPWVQADGHTIRMTVIPSLQEFLGYDDPGAFVTEVGGKTNKLTSPTPLPKFRVRKVQTSAAVFDGQTLVIGAGSAKHLVQKRNPDGTTTNTFVEKELFFFITPTLIDAAGNRLHSEEEQPFARKNAPPR